MPPDRAEPAALYAAAQSAWVAGQNERAGELLEAALGAAGTGSDLRADVLCAYARLRALSGGAPGLAEQLTDEAPSYGPQARCKVLVEAAYLRLYAFGPETVPAARAAHLATTTGADVADEVTRARAAIILGGALALAGETAESAHYLNASVDLLRVTGSPQELVHLLNTLTVALTSLERYDDAHAVCRRQVRVLRTVGADGPLAMALCLLAHTAYFLADFDVMETAAAEALALAGGAGQDAVAGFATGCLSLVHAVRGEHQLAREQAVGALELLDRGGTPTLAWLPRYALAMNAMSAGEWNDACARFDDIERLDSAMARRTGILHWRVDRIEARWRAGHADEAHRGLAELDEPDAGTGPWDHATALRVRALLTGDGSAEEHFAAAVEAHDTAASPFERARTELCWGEWLVEHGRGADAQPHLDRAQLIFADRQATAWIDRIGELRRHAHPVPASPQRRRPTQVRAFGPLTVIEHGVATPVPLDQPGRLLHLLVGLGGAVHLDQMAAMLWPGEDLSGSARPRNVVARTRERYGPIVVRHGEVVRWADHVEVDTTEFEGLARLALRFRTGPEATDPARRAVELYRGDLMPTERDLEEVAAARERLRRTFLAMLDLLADDDLRAGRHVAATDLLRRAVEAAPEDELRYAKLATACLDQDDLTGARAVVDSARHAATEYEWPTCTLMARVERRLDEALSRAMEKSG